MFGWLKKDPEKKRPAEEFERIVTQHYEGSVVSSDYNVNDPAEYPFHNLFPHGVGKIVYSYGGAVVESYEGEFEGGQYSGQGKLFKNGEVFEGFFEENEFIE
jgi:hypothetical protein